MTTPPIPSGALAQVAEYSGYIGVAFAGSFLRASKWRDDVTGKIIWFRVMTEIPTAIAVGAVAVGIGEYYHLDNRIIGGICGLLGLLGPAFFSSLGDAVISILKAKLGSG